MEDNAARLEDMKQEFISLLRSTERDGVEQLIEWLELSDFFTAPASTNKHAAYEGGLLNHSLNVYKVLQNFAKPLKEKLREDSIIICGLLHDLCKANFYVKGKRNRKIDGKWVELEEYMIDDQLPFGHGEKSVYIIMKHMQLTDEEALAIRWHMGGYDDAARSYIGGTTQANAYANYPLCVALNIADMYTAYLLHT